MEYYENDWDMYWDIVEDMYSNLSEEELEGLRVTGDIFEGSIVYPKRLASHLFGGQNGKEFY